MIYLAGKCNDLKWRIAKQCRGEFVASDGYTSHSPIDHKSASVGGWFYGEDHDDYVQPGSKDIPEKAFHRVRRASALVAIVDEPEAYGTVAEIAMAATRDIPTLLVIITPFPACSLRDKIHDAYWFVGSLPGVTTEIVGDEAGAVRAVRKFTGKMTYREYLDTDHWKQLRARKLEAASYKCQLCAGKVRLQVHHNDYSRLGREIDSDLVVLCHQCHDKHHAGKVVPIEVTAKGISA